MCYERKRKYQNNLPNFKITGDNKIDFIDTSAWTLINQKGDKNIDILTKKIINKINWRKIVMSGILTGSPAIAARSSVTLSILYCSVILHCKNFSIKKVWKKFLRKKEKK